MSSKRKLRASKDRPMTNVDVNLPVDVIDELKIVAKQLGFSGIKPLIRYYVSSGLRNDLRANQSSPEPEQNSDSAAGSEFCKEENGHVPADKTLVNAAPSSFDRYYDQFSRWSSSMKPWRIILTDGKNMIGYPYASSQINIFCPVFSFVTVPGGNSFRIPFSLLVEARVLDETKTEKPSQ